MLGSSPPTHEAWYHIQGEVPMRERYNIDPPDWWRFHVYNSQGQREIVSEWEMTYDALTRPLRVGQYGESIPARALPRSRI